jgi:hypothetical protein
MRPLSPSEQREHCSISGRTWNVREWTALAIAVAVEVEGVCVC